MVNRSVKRAANRDGRWILAGFALLVTAPLVAAGCGRSLEGEYISVCKASWQAADDCENISKVAVDLEKEYRNCENNADNFAAEVEDVCGADYEILGDNIDRCISSLNDLGQVCRDDHKSDYLKALGVAGDDCNETFYRCK